MALHLYDRVIKRHNTRADMSAIPSMSWHLNNNIPGKVFNIYVNVSTYTKLSTCEICTYDIKHFSGILLFKCQDIEDIADMSARVL